MDEYHFLADITSTWRSTNDWVKGVTVIGFYTTVCVIVAILGLFRPLMMYKLRKKHKELEIKLAEIEKNLPSKVLDDDKPLN